MIKYKTYALLAALILCITGCITPEAVTAISDAANEYKTNRPPATVTNVVVVTNTVTNSVTTPSNGGVGNVTGHGTNILLAAKWNRYPRVDFVAPAIESRKAVGSKGIVGQLFLNGKKVEWIARGRGWSTIHNATVPGKYYQELRPGQEVTISIADLDGKNESNRIVLVIP